MATTNNPAVVVWCGVSTGGVNPTTNPTDFTITGNGDLLMGGGPMQSHVAGEPSTIGAKRTDWGDDSVAPYLHACCPCMVHEFPGHGFTALSVLLNDLETHPKGYRHYLG